MTYRPETGSHFWLPDIKQTEEFYHPLTSPIIDERRQEVRALRADTVHALRERKPILIHRQTAHGDMMVHAGAYNAVLEILCDEEGIDRRSINLQATPNGNNYFFSHADAYHEVEKRVTRIREYDDMQTPNFYLERLRAVATTHGIELPSGVELYIPQPLPLQGTALQDFNAELVKQQGDNLQTDIAEPIISINQSGTHDQKRFSDPQVIAIVQLLRKIAPHVYIQIITDKAFRTPRRNNVSHFEAIADNVTSTTNINEIGARMASSLYTISTDSFWGWLSSGIYAMKTDGTLPQGTMTILYTLAFPECWGVPGAEMIESPALTRYRESKPYHQQTITPGEYHLAGRHQQRMGIDESDMRLLFQAVESRLSQGDI